MLKMRDVEQLRELYGDAANRELHDLTGFQPPRTFDSVYRNFVTVVDAFKYICYTVCSFVDVQRRQTVQLIDAWFKGAGELGEFTATPVQVLTFDGAGKIVKFEAFFTPRVVDFSKL